MSEAKMTQTEMVLDYIGEFGSITQLDALRDLGVMRLASRMSDLKKLGFTLIKEREAVKNRYGDTCYIARYRIKELEQ